MFDLVRIKLMVLRSAKVTITKAIPKTGTPDSTTTTSELQESFDPYVFSALKTKPRHFTMPSKIQQTWLVLGHVNFGEELQRGI